MLCPASVNLGMFSAIPDSQVSEVLGIDHIDFLKTNTASMVAEIIANLPEAAEPIMQEEFCPVSCSASGQKNGWGKCRSAHVHTS